MNDSHQHLFFKCSYSEAVWKEIRAKVQKIQWDMDWKNVITELATGRCGNNIRSVLERIVLATSVYYIWNERNLRLFNQSQRDSQSLIN